MKRTESTSFMNHALGVVEGENFTWKSFIMPGKQVSLTDEMKSKLNENEIYSLSNLITMDSHMFHSDSFLCGIFKGYPLYWPKIYCLKLMITYILRIMSSVSDMVLFVQSVEYNNKFFNNWDTDSKDYNWIETFEPIAFKSDVSARILFTFLPAFLMSWIISFRLNKAFCSNDGNIGIMFLISFAFLFLIMVFVYKVLISLVSLGQLAYAVLLLCHKKGILFSKMIESMNSMFEMIFLQESILSSWPLWLISVLEIQNSSYYNGSKQSLEYYFLVLKIVSAGLSILLEINDTYLWRVITHNKKVFTLKCDVNHSKIEIINHTNEPKPNFETNDNQMQLELLSTSLVSTDFMEMDENSDDKCNKLNDDNNSMSTNEIDEKDEKRNENTEPTAKSQAITNKDTTAATEANKADEYETKLEGSDEMVECKCICGKDLELTKPCAVYTGGATCDGCKSSIEADEAMYHCSSNLHVNGFDLCVKCAVSLLFFLCTFIFFAFVFIFCFVAFGLLFLVLYDL